VINCSYLFELVSADGSPALRTACCMVAPWDKRDPVYRRSICRKIRYRGSPCR